MHSLKQWIMHNWPLKIVSLLLAVVVWAAVANEAPSEISLEVPLEYHNVPLQMEITGDMTTVVQVRLRGASNVIKEITAQDVAATVDLSQMRPGEQIVALSPRNVQVPFGAEVVRVIPSSVRFVLERTLVKQVPVVPKLLGQPAAGYEVARVWVSPDSVEVEGPESRVSPLSGIVTVPIRLDQKQSSAEQSADLDLTDSQIRVRNPAPVKVKIEIRHKP